MSDASSPRGASMTPPPATADGAAQQPTQQQSPDPLMVGKRFVKQYYQVLSTTPDQIHRFYQPSSVLSHGEGSEPTVPITFGSTQSLASDDDKEEKSNTLKDRFYSNFSQPTDDDTKTHIRFEFEHGAIDAQASVNDGILLVATGQVVYSYTTENDADDGGAILLDENRKSFVHTFFLNHSSQGTKRFYYVHNDILRFLYQEEPASEPVEPEESEEIGAVAAPAAAVAEDEPASATTDSAAEQPLQLQEPEEAQDLPEADVGDSSAAQGAVEAPIAPAAEAAVIETDVPDVPEVPTATISIDEAPGGGVEETKEELDTPLISSTEEAVLADESTLEKEVAEVSKEVEAPIEAAPAAPEEDASKENRGAPPSGKGRGKSGPGGKKQPPPQQQVSKPPPGSWASLVAGGGGGGPAPATVKPPPKPDKTTSAELGGSSTAQASTSSANQHASDTKDSNTGGRDGGSSNTGSGGGRDRDRDGGRDRDRDRDGAGGQRSHQQHHHPHRPPKRDPDCTLVIKNLADNTKEKDVLDLFEPFAQQTKSKIVGITVSAHRGIAFVDYDNVSPVMKAVAQHSKEQMTLLGRPLEVDQKTAEQRARRAQQRGGNYRSGSPGNGGMYRGRGGHHGGRRSGGRGDHRGGGRGGRGGR